MKSGWVGLAQRFRNRRLLIVVGCICVGIAAVAVAPSILFWEWLSGEESGSTTIRNIALVVAGALALGLALWRSLVAERQADTAQLSLLNERYQKGAGMLGSEVLSVRLGGIYALQRLAEQHPGHYHIQVMNLFCAFLRHPTKDQSLDPGQLTNKPGTLLGIRQDMEAVLEAICSRDKSRIALERREDFRLDLRGATLPGVQLLNADLSNAMFHHAEMPGANIANTDLTDAFFTSANLSQASLYRMKFKGTRFGSANLSGALLQDTEFTNADFHDADLSGANLWKANLHGAIFQDAKLCDAWLESANLSSSGFGGADLSGARLVKTDLSGSQFLNASLDNANLTDANLSGVAFSVGGPQRAKGLTQAQLDQAWANPNDTPNLTGVIDTETGLQLVWRGNGK